MNVDEAIGLTRTQMEYELRWAMQRAPSDPAKRLDYVVNALIGLMEKNNRAIAEALAERSDLADGES